MFKVNNKNIFHTFFTISIAHFEQVNIGWGGCNFKQFVEI